MAMKKSKAEKFSKLEFRANLLMGVYAAVCIWDQYRFWGQAEKWGWLLGTEVIVLSLIWLGSHITHLFAIALQEERSAE